jgi:hypothetical protein
MLVGACSETAGPHSQSPRLSQGDAERLMLRADDIKSSGPVGLDAVFRGRALQILEGQAERFESRGTRIEEQDTKRTLVFWDPIADEAVLQVIGRRRAVSRDDPNPRWAANIRQWWARLEYSNGTWWIVDQQDLPPDRWRTAPINSSFTGGVHATDTGRLTSS